MAAFQKTVTIEVEAYQVPGKGEDLKPFYSWARQVWPFSIGAYCETRPLLSPGQGDWYSLNAPFAPIPVKVGDWVVVDTQGRITVYSPAIFIASGYRPKEIDMAD